MDTNAPKNPDGPQDPEPEPTPSPAPTDPTPPKPVEHPDDRP